MPIVSPSELARMRAALEAWNTETATVERLTHTPDNKGGYTNTRVTVWTGKVGRKPSTETRGAVTEQNVGAMETALSYWLFRFPAETDVRPDDEIHAAGRVYNVTGQLDKSIEIARYVIAVEP